MSRDYDPGGGVDTALTIRHEFFENVKMKQLSGDVSAPQTYRVTPDAQRKHHFVVLGAGFLPNSQVYVDGRFCRTHFNHAGELEFVYTGRLTPDASIMVQNQPVISINDAVAKSVTITALNVLTELPLRTEQSFALSINFQTAAGTPARLLRLTAQFPDGQNNTQTYRISDEDNAAGRKIIEGFRVGAGGTFELHATMYDEAGNADFVEKAFPVVPSNPVQLYVYPRFYSTGSGKGAAQYNSSNNRYYCRARFVVSNGNPYDIVAGPLVRCRVSDSGLGQLANFSFTISTTTVPAYSTRTLYIYTYFTSSSDVHDLFDDFGDAKFEFWLSTTAGEKYDWNVWVAMAQVGITANFVGDFSYAEKLKVREIIDTHASAVLSDVDCIFTPNTPILNIPSTHPDWGRYRDIHVEENKGGSCVDSDEADDMRDDWSAPAAYNNRIDIFFVESFSGDACASSLGGFSPVDGPSGKGGSNSGIVIDIDDLNILSSSVGEKVLGIIIAHEVGHYLGLNHTNTANNFMRPTVSTSNTDVTYNQWKEMRDHFFVRRRNP